MKNIVLSLLLLGAAQVGYANNDFYFAAQPSLSPDAKSIYFSYDRGIWTVPADGGVAMRITGMKGYQSRPRVSPDGKWLAFTSDEQGNENVYVTPIGGGTIRQLTFHEAADKVVSWSADSRSIYFESDRYNDATTYNVSIDGGTPTRLFPNYFNTIVNLVENPQTGSFYFNKSTESFRYTTRKGYKGENNPDIEEWNPKTNKYTQITTYNGKDVWPSVDKNGNLYWATDEDTGVYNLAKSDAGKTTLLTDFDTAVLTPSVSHDGSKIVFLKDYQIYLYDVATKKTVKPVISLYDSDEPATDLAYYVDGNITAVDASPDGNKLAFVSRGRLFVSDTKGLFVRQIPTDEEERVVEVKWAKDSKTIYYTRSRKGWYNLYKITVDGSRILPEKALHTPDAFVKSLTMSHDLSKMAFITGSNHISLLNCNNDRVETLAENEFWSFRDYEIRFSPDDKYIAYNAMNLFERDVFVCNLQTKEVINLTGSATSEVSPDWSPDGKYMYIAANRQQATFPRGGSHNLYRIALDKHSAPLATQQFNDLFEKKEKDSTISISIDTDQIQLRWEAIQRQGNQNNLKVIKGSKDNYLLYSSNHEGGRGVYSQKLTDFDQKPAGKIAGLTSLGSISYNGKTLYALERGNIYSVDLSGNKTTKIDIKHSFARNNRAEFRQMFHEVWALLAANFYDPDLHGTDWVGKQAYYEKFIPKLKSRNDLRTLINDMLGELNSSHLGFTSTGKEEQTSTRITTLETGLLFDDAKPYVVKNILKNSIADHKTQKIKVGDELTAVNGVAVDKAVNREFYFSSPADKKELTLTFKRGNESFYEIVHIGHYSETKTLLYADWEENCERIVDEKTNGRVAYHHMRDMGNASLERFIIDMSTKAVNKDALILDLRYNNGGNVHDEVLEYLTRRSHFTWRYRNGQVNTHPNVTPGDKPIVFLINERSLSDAEVTSNGVKTLGIGKLIGTETYRWIIFTSGAQLVDGSFCRLPAWGCFNMKGEDMEQVGVSPDIYVKNTFEDRVLGKDPQLDRAIDEILKDLQAR